MSFGGHVALLATACLRLPASAVLYAGWLAGTDIALSRPEPTGSLAPRIAAAGGRVLAITGEADAMVPLDDVATVRRWFAAAGADLDVVTYPNVGHRFCAEGRPGYDAVAAADAWLRVGAHLGPVYPIFDPVLATPAFMGSHVSRTARIEPVAPPGDVYVTEQFAAALVLESSRFECRYVGHVPAAKDYGRLRMYRLGRLSPSG